MKINIEPFGIRGKELGIYKYSITNNNGISVVLSNVGAAIVSLFTPDKAGELKDIVLGFDTPEKYINNAAYIGVVCGRYANRIANAHFSIDNKRFQLVANNGKNSLHGGAQGFDKRIWKAETVEFCDEAGVKFTYHSPDGEEGYPGNLIAHVEYLLNNKNELLIKFIATTDKTTVVNLTHHSYFNLNGCTHNILDHELTLNATHITTPNNDLIPTGNIDDISGTALDFSKSKKVGRDIAKLDNGYDHNYVLQGNIGELRSAARLADPDSGRVLEVYTTQPGIQLYTGNFLDDSIIGKNNIVYHKNYGLCLETQHYPDSPNQPQFPSTMLKPDGTYLQFCMYRFSTQ